MIFMFYFFLRCYVVVPMGNPMGTHDPMSMGLGIKLNLSWS